GIDAAFPRAELRRQETVIARPIAGGEDHGVEVFLPSPGEFRAVLGEAGDVGRDAYPARLDRRHRADIDDWNAAGIDLSEDALFRSHAAVFLQPAPREIEDFWEHLFVQRLRHRPA